MHNQKWQHSFKHQETKGVWFWSTQNCSRALQWVVQSFCQHKLLPLKWHESHHRTLATWSITFSKHQAFCSMSGVKWYYLYLLSPSSGRVACDPSISHSASGALFGSGNLASHCLCSAHPRHNVFFFICKQEDTFKYLKAEHENPRKKVYS